MQHRAIEALLGMLSACLSFPAMAQPVERVSAEMAASEPAQTAEAPIACVRQSIEAGVAIVRVTTSDRCAPPVAAKRMQISWRDTFRVPRYCHAQGTACSFELGADRRWPDADSPTS